MEFRACGDNWFKDFDREPICLAPSDSRQALRDDRLDCGGGRMEFSGYGYN
jgi:hypothetical protein